MIKRLEYLDHQLTLEFNRTRTTLVVNTNFTDKTAKEIAKIIDKGEGYISENAMTSKYGLGTTIIPATNGATILLGLIVALEDDIYKKLGLPRDTINNGSNNHNLEIVLANQFGLESLLTKQMLRQNHYDDFFIKLSDVLDVPAPDITLQISPIEFAKLRLLEATVLEAEVKAKNLANQEVAQTTAATSTGEAEHVNA